MTQVSDITYHDDIFIYDNKNYNIKCIIIHFDVSFSYINVESKFKSRVKGEIIYLKKLINLKLIYLETFINLLFKTILVM